MVHSHVLQCVRVCVCVCVWNVDCCITNSISDAEARAAPTLSTCNDFTCVTSVVQSDHSLPWARATTCAMWGSLIKIKWSGMVIKIGAHQSELPTPFQLYHPHNTRSVDNSYHRHLFTGKWIMVQGSGVSGDQSESSPTPFQLEHLHKPQNLGNSYHRRLFTGNWIMVQGSGVSGDQSESSPTQFQLDHFHKPQNVGNSYYHHLFTRFSSDKMV